MVARAEKEREFPQLFLAVIDAPFKQPFHSPFHPIPHRQIKKYDQKNRRDRQIWRAQCYGEAGRDEPEERKLETFQDENGQTENDGLIDDRIDVHQTVARDGKSKPRRREDQKKICRPVAYGTANPAEAG